MSYPKITDDNFGQSITNKFLQYKIPKKKKSFEDFCFPKKFQLQYPQQLLSKIINPKSPYKGMLVYHRIGAGKTCTAINIAEQWKHIRKIIVVVPASLIGNFRGELRSQCAGNEYMKDKEREQLKLLHPSDKKYKEIIKKSDERINQYYNIYSYNKFVELIKENKINLRNTILIIDEIQNMISDGGTFYETLYEAIHNAPDNLRVVLLSATPMFDKPVEIALTLNLLRIPYELPTGKAFEKMFIKTTKNKTNGTISYKAKNLDKFKETVKGYISFFRGAPPYVFPNTTIKYVKCVMQEFQYKSYVTVLKKEFEDTSTRVENIRSFKKGQIIDLPNNFFIGTRIISNIAFPNKNINEKGYNSFCGKSLETDNLINYSIKFYKILKKIQNSPGPVFVYSNFLEFGGIKSFVKVLEAHDYRNYSEYGEGRKRFAIFSGNENKQYKDEIKGVFNQLSNSNGSKIKIFIGSSAAREGLSLLSVRQVHILEPYWNDSLIQQVMGRAIRYCSHKNLPEEKRDVKVYIYLATHPNEKMTIDQYISKLAIKKKILIDQFENAIKEVAIDCQLNYNANVYEGEDEIECYK